MPSRDSRKQGNDEDFVPATQYPKITKETQIPELPNDQSTPNFDPLPINNNSPHGEPNLPPGLDGSDAFGIFRLFFTDELVDLIVYYTNANARKARSEKNLQQWSRLNRWKDVSRPEMYAYFGVLIYMGIHKEPAIDDYWKKKKEYIPRHPISSCISRDRFLAIDQWLYCEDPRQSTTFTCPFQRIWAVSEHLRKASRRYYKPGIHLAVDESIKRFTGRAKEIVNIPSKPTPEGFKMWVLANEGYVLDWLFHSKGSGKDQGPYKLDTYWTKKENFTPTEAVVLDLLLRKQEDGPSFCNNSHIVWIDNLFTSIKLLERLRQEGIGGAGTIRTTRTKREQSLEKQKTGRKCEKTAQNTSQGSQIANQDLDQTSTYQELPGMRGKKRKNTSQNCQSQSQNPRKKAKTTTDGEKNVPRPTSTQSGLTQEVDKALGTMEAWENGQFPSRVLTQVLNEASSQEKFPIAPSEDPEDTDEEPGGDIDDQSKERFSQTLMNIKLYHTDKLQWGELYWDVSRNKTVLQAAWKDAQVVLFASTVARPEESIERERKRPSKTSTNAKCTRLVFGDLAVKVLAIPLFIDLYNHFMNGVDRFDQCVSYYSTQRVKRKTWKPIWFFLFDLVLSNSYRLSSFFSKPDTKSGGHQNFLQRLLEDLLQASAKPAQKHDSRPSMAGATLKSTPHGSKPAGMGKKKTCAACAAAGRKRNSKKRIILGELDPNVPLRAPETRFGCEICQIPLCQSKLCWEEHLKQVELLKSMS